MVLAADIRAGQTAVVIGNVPVGRVWLQEAGVAVWVRACTYMLVGNMQRWLSQRRGLQLS
jgi:hypothetical protein